MREKWQQQMALMAHITNHPQCQKLEAIRAIIDDKPTICETILRDLNNGMEPSRRPVERNCSHTQALCFFVDGTCRLTYFDQLFKMKAPSLTACSPHMA